MPRELTEIVLKKTIPQREQFNRYWNGSGKRPVCLKTRIPTTIARYRDTLAGFEDYLMSYAASPAYKERVIRPFLVEWIERIASFFGEQMIESEDFLPHFIRNDKTVELLKLLQQREGISKSKLQQELGVGYRTVQNDLRALSPSLGKVDQELKIGGHVIHVDVKEKRLTDNQKIYHSPNTVNPLILFPNVMMTGKLLQSLAQDTESDVAQYIGADIWIQLTEYYKERIRSVYAKRDEQLTDFLDMIEYRISHGHVFGFLTERDMVLDNLPEELLRAYKGNRLCDLTLTLNDRQIERKSQKILILENHYRAINVDDVNDYIDFIEENVIEIELC